MVNGVVRQIQDVKTIVDAEQGPVLLQTLIAKLISKGYSIHNSPFTVRQSQITIFHSMLSGAV